MHGETVQQALFADLATDPMRILSLVLLNRWVIGRLGFYTFERRAVVACVRTSRLIRCLSFVGLGFVRTMTARIVVFHEPVTEIRNGQLVDLWCLARRRIPGSSP